MIDRLKNQFPSSDPGFLVALGAVWTRELEQILSRMLEICAEATPRLPLQGRSEVILKLARLTLWLEHRIISTKVAQRPIENTDPVEEGRDLLSPSGKERVENTARNLAQGWNRLLEQVWRKYPALGSTEAPRRFPQTGNTESDFVGRQHFSPAFSNKHWAAGKENTVRVYSIGLDHRIWSKDVGYRSWARERHIYSQHLEHHFGLIEGDGQTPYLKLIRGEPLSEADRRHWVAFLAAQMFRTPSFLIQNLTQLRELIALRGIQYPADLASLRRVHETLFTNPDVFGPVYELIVGRKWELWRPVEGSQFVRSDNPVLISRGWRGDAAVFYPMTPDLCFVAGPDIVRGDLQLVPDSRQLDALKTAELNRRMCATARESVLARPEAGDTELKATLEPVLGRQWIELVRANSFLPPYWGGLGQ